MLVSLSVLIHSVADRSVLSAVVYLHQHDIVHRDLK